MFFGFESIFHIFFSLSNYKSIPNNHVIWVSHIYNDSVLADTILFFPFVYGLVHCLFWITCLKAYQKGQIYVPCLCLIYVVGINISNLNLLDLFMKIILNMNLSFKGRQIVSIDTRKICMHIVGMLWIVQQ